MSGAFITTGFALGDQRLGCETRHGSKGARTP